MEAFHRDEILTSRAPLVFHPVNQLDQHPLWALVAVHKEQPIEVDAHARPTRITVSPVVGGASESKSIT